LLRSPIGPIQDIVTRHLAGCGPAPAVLEAGCGRFKHFAYPAGTVLSGLDISQRQLDLNENLSERILGDVQTYQTTRTFDATVSMYVLEHLAHPRRALQNLLQWTRPGGIIVIGVPNVLSLRGLVTKFTPFWAHELAYKLIYRRDISPFPTTLKFSIAPRALGDFFAGHEIVFQGFGQEKIRPPFGYVYDLLICLLRVLSLGRYHPENMNFFLVVQKREGGGPEREY